MRPATRALAVLALTAFLPIRAIGQDATAQCTNEFSDLDDAISSHIFTRVTEENTDLLEKALRDTPLFAARSEQTNASTVGESGASIVNDSNFTKLLAAAFDQGVGGEDVDATTINVNPFLFAAMVDSDVYYDQARYERPEYAILRRFGGSVSFGGKGDEVDQDGDGSVDEALAAEEIDDIVGWEFRYRVLGSRDRRERDNHKLILAGFTAIELMKLPEAKERVRVLVPDDLRGTTQETRNCVRWDEALERVAVREALDAAVAEFRRQNQKFEDALDEVDRKPLLTLAVTGVERAQKFGDDKIGAGLRGSWKDLTASFDWSRVDPAGMKALDEMKFGAEWARPVLQDLLGKNGVDASIAVALEILEDAPGVEHTKIFKTEAKLEIPISKGVSLPISLMWANHADFVKDADEVIGRFGITVDTAAIWDFAKDNRGGDDSE